MLKKTSILVMLDNGETSVIIDNLDEYKNVQPYIKG